MRTTGRNWAQIMAPSLAEAAQARSVDNERRRLEDEAYNEKLATSVGAGAGALIGAFTPVGPVIGAGLGSVVAGQGARVAQGKGFGFDDTASGVQAATQTTINIAGANRAINAQAARDNYDGQLAMMIEPGNEDMMSAYEQMPLAHAKRFEDGNIDVFNSWYRGNGWTR